MEPDEDHQQVNMSDLFSVEDLVDRLVGAVTKSDVAACLFYIRQLEMRKRVDLVNEPHSLTNQTALMAASTKESTRAAQLLVRILACKGAKLPSADSEADWLADVQSWAIELLEAPVQPDSEQERETQMLLALDYDAAQDWCMRNLPPPEQSDEALEDYGGYTSDDLGHGRAVSVPLDDAIMHPKPTQRATTADPMGTVGEGAANGAGGGSGLSARAAGKRAARSQVPETIIDLTSSRTPSPAPKNEDLDDMIPNGAPPSPPGRKRPRSRSPPPQPGQGREQPRQPEARAHLHVAHLPSDFTNAELATLFDGVPGVLEVEIYGTDTNAPFGYVSLASLATAQHAYALKHNTLPRIGANRNIELKIYSADGTPLDAHRQVEPVINNINGGGPGGGIGARDVPPPRVFNNYGGPMPGAMPMRYPRPRVPFYFTAAELARRVYLGCLRWGITDAEVAALFHERAGVVAKVLRVMNAHDGSHAFGFVQLPDAITADHAIKVLHGTVCEGHLLQVEHVNELNHRWLWSLTLHGLPLRWDYRDVSDFLISTIRSFAGLIVRHSPPYSGDAHAAELHVRIELRYETELRWAFNELNGLMIDRQPIRAVIDQARVRREVENELAFQQLAQGIANGQHDPQQGQRIPSVTPMLSVHGGASAPGYDPRDPAGTNGGATPTQRRPQPPPPPPPPAAPPKTAVPALDDDALNPFSPKWLMSNR
ncbi:hypothetical protein JCM10908_002161 [Rhodotorula pacifica]|uniref:uncharacterized protein n=1 Tax=Rhodotorula pacifica TaxID=1495444 RepID=UPI003170BA6A